MSDAPQMSTQMCQYLRILKSPLQENRCFFTHNDLLTVNHLSPYTIIHIINGRRKIYPRDRASIIFQQLISWLVLLKIMQNPPPSFPKNGREDKKTQLTNCSQVVTSLAIIMLRFPNLAKSRLFANGKHIKTKNDFHVSSHQYQITDTPLQSWHSLVMGVGGGGQKARWIVNHVGHLLCLLLVIMIFHPTD